MRGTRFPRPVLLTGAIVTAVAAAAAALATASDDSRSAQATVAQGAVVVRGKPLFPIMLLDQCDAAAAAGRAKAIGANIVLNADCGSVSPDDQLRSLSGAQLGVLPIKGRAVSGERLLGWAYPDEPDNNGWSASGLATSFHYRRGSRDGLLSFVTTTGRFFSGPDPAAASRLAQSFTRIADVAGFDLYPLNHCSTHLRSVYDAQRRFARLAAGTPTFQWIETGLIDTRYCGGVEVTPEQLTAEAWLAVVGGARGIGFFTHTSWPAVSDFAVAPAVQAAIRRFSSIAAAIRPGLTGTTVAASADTPDVLTLARVAGGRTYVVAVNTLESAVPTTLTVPRANGAKLHVVGENRTVSTSGDRFADTFPPLGVHVYASS